MPSLVWRAGLSNELLAGCGVQSARAAVIVGGEGIEEQVGLLESGSADLVIGTPQRFWDVINSATAVRHRRSASPVNYMKLVQPSARLHTRALDAVERAGVDGRLICGG